MKLTLAFDIFNKERWMESLLDSWISNLSGRHEYEIIIVFDDCRDRSEEIARQYLSKYPYPCKFLHADNKYEIFCNNLVLEHATGDYIVFIQDDNWIYDKDWDALFVQTIERVPNAGIIGLLAGLRVFRDSRVLNSARLEVDRPHKGKCFTLHKLPVYELGLWQVDAVCRPFGISRQLLLDCGGLEKAFMPTCGDDLDLSLKLLEQGKTNLYIPFDLLNVGGDKETMPEQMRKETGSHAYSLNYQRHATFLANLKKASTRMLSPLRQGQNNSLEFTSPQSYNRGLTIFALPKAFKGSNAVIQRNAIKSWMHLSPKPEIILMGSDAGVAEYAAELGLRHIHQVRKNEFGTPLVSDIFSLAQEAATNDVLMYINSDIILMDDFQVALNTVRGRFDEFLMVGQRWDTDIDSEINFDVPGWQEQLRELVHQQSALFSVCGIDYFAFTRGIWPAIPDFGIGRTIWDNWLVWKPNTEGRVVVDATEAVMAVHQDHEYVPSPGRLNEEAINRGLSENCDSFGFTSYTVWKCTPVGVAMRHPGEFFSKSDWVGGINYIEKALAHDQATIEKWCRHSIACMTPEVLKIVANTAKDLLAKQPLHSGATLAMKCIAEKVRAIGEVMLKRGTEYLRNSNAEESLKWFDVLVGLDVPNLNYARAVALCQFGKFGSARQACLEELKVQPEHKDVQALLAQIDAESKVQANELCKRGILKMQAGNFADALVDFESAAQRTFFAGPVPNLNYATAVALSQLGKFFAAKQACLEELKVQPGHTEAAELLKMLNTAIEQNTASNEKGESKIKTGASHLLKECV